MSATATTETVRVALIGCGGFAKHHARRVAAREDAEVVALVDVSSEATEKFAEACEVPASVPHFTDAAAMYDEIEPDAVMISTPHTLHYDHIMAALDRGVHVLVEKPMVTSADHARAVMARQEQTGTAVVIGYNTACSRELEFVRRTVRDGSLGRLELISGYISQNWMKATVGTWRQKPELSGGGQAYDSGAHPITSVLWPVESMPAEVHAFVDNHGTPVDINSVTNVRFENGVFASITISGNCPTHGTFLTFIFDGGRIDMDGWGAGWIKVFKGKDEVDDPLADVDFPPAGYTGDDNLIDVVLGKAEARATPVQGLRHAQLMDMIYASQAKGGAVKAGEI